MRSLLLFLVLLVANACADRQRSCEPDCTVPEALVAREGSCDSHYADSPDFWERGAIQDLPGCATLEPHPDVPGTTVATCRTDKPLYPACTELVGSGGGACPDFARVVAVTRWNTRENGPASDFVDLRGARRCVDSTSREPVIVLDFHTRDAPEASLPDADGRGRMLFDGRGEMLGFDRNPYPAGRWRVFCCGEEQIIADRASWGTVPSVDCTDARPFSAEDALQALVP